MWALGIVLFQLLHDGDTPWEGYKRLETMNVAMAISDVRMRIKYERERAWAGQKQLVAETLATESLGGALRGAGKNGVVSRSVRRGLRNAGMLREQMKGLVFGGCSPLTLLEAAVHVKLEFLFRICERCLVFQPDERVSMEGLSRLASLEVEYFGKGMTVQLQTTSSNHKIGCSAGTVTTSCSRDRQCSMCSTHVVRLGERDLHRFLLPMLTSRNKCPPRHTRPP